MKNLKTFLIVLVLFAAAAAAAVSAQPRVNGKVVGVIDGKTVLIEMPNRSRLVAQLQHIEVPEAGQPLNQTAVEHLRALVLDRVIEYRARRLRGTVSVGQIFLKGVDISQQMIRDGAAWYAVPEKNGHDAAESEIYQSNETQAKTEKRGIWAIENLKPSWQIRAEAAEEENRRRAAEKIARQAADRTRIETAPKSAGKSKARPQPQPLGVEAMMWETPTAKGANVSNIGGLLTGYNARANVSYIATPLLNLDIPGGKIFQSFSIGIGYFYVDSQTKGREGVYLVGVETNSEDFRFLKFNDLTVTADDQKIVIGKALSRKSQRGGGSVREIMLYQIKRSVLTKIANAESVKVKVGTYSTTVNSDARAMLKNLLNVAE